MFRLSGGFFWAGVEEEVAFDLGGGRVLNFCRPYDDHTCSFPLI